MLGKVENVGVEGIAMGRRAAGYTGTCHRVFPTYISVKFAVWKKMYVLRPMFFELV